MQINTYLDYTKLAREQVSQICETISIILKRQGKPILFKKTYVCVPLFVPDCDKQVFVDVTGLLLGDDDELLFTDQEGTRHNVTDLETPEALVTLCREFLNLPEEIFS